MATERREIKCPWCKESVSVTEIKTDSCKNELGNVIERSCGKCGRIQAAYAESEGSFLPKIRTF